MRYRYSWIAGSILILAAGFLISLATRPPVSLSAAEAGGLSASAARSSAPAPDVAAPPPPLGVRSGSFARGTITVKVSGSVGGIQTGPFADLAFTEADRGRTLIVRPGRVVSAAGEDLPRPPVHLYRSLVGPVGAGAEVMAFSEPPIRQIEEVAADRTGGVLVWRVEPGNYFVFFPRTRPMVRVSPGVQPSTVSYTITIE